MTFSTRLLCFLATLLCATSRIIAQTCPPQWQPGLPGQPLLGTVNALRTFDPDGTGPLGTWLIAGGSNLSQRITQTSPLRAFDGATWRSITGDAPGQDGTIYALTVFNGELIAAGNFSSIAGVPANNIARWDGTTWRTLGQGVASIVFTLEVHAGSLFVGGNFQTVGGSVTSPGVARWNGSAWSAVSNAMSTAGVVYSLRSFRNNLYAGGSFTALGGVSASNLAVWNNTSWAAFANPNNTVRDVQSFTGTATTQDRLFITGDFSLVAGQAADRVATWNPSASTWAQAGTPPPGPARRLAVRSSGVSSFQLSALFDGTLYNLTSGAWTQVGSATSPGNSFVSAMTLYNGQWALGRTSQSLDSAVKHLSSNLWTNLGPGVPGHSSLVADAGSGAVVIATTFPSTSTLLNTYPRFDVVSRRDPNSNTWTQLGGAFRGGGTVANLGVIYDLDVMPNGDIIAGGDFQSIGDLPIAKVARWNGTSWNAIGDPFNATVYDLLVMPNGDIYAAGEFTQVGSVSITFGIARWNGTAWTNLAAIPGVFGKSRSLARHTSGDIIVAGNFVADAALTNFVLRWNGTVWNTVGSSGFPFRDGWALDGLAVAPSGKVAVSFRYFDGANPGSSELYIWDPASPTTWTQTAEVAISSQTLRAAVSAMKFLPDDSLIVTGSFYAIFGVPPTVTINAIARWNGTWSQFSPDGITQRFIPAGSFAGMGEDIELLSTGELVVVGDFTHADNVLSAYFARATLPTFCGCDDIDFNNNEAFPEDQDVIDFFNVLAGGACSAGNTCNDIDFNNNDAFPEDQDVIDFFNVLAGGTCS